MTAETINSPLVCASDLIGYYNIMLDFLQRSSPDQIEFGPTYETITSRGFGISIDTYMRICRESTSLVLLGYDDTDTPVAYMDNSCQSSGQDIMSEGYVVTSRRGVGIGSSVVCVNEDMLQRFASIEGKRVVYEVFNGNIKQLKGAESGLINFLHEGGNPNSEEGLEWQKLADLCRKEQERWQSIFGSQGKFGYVVSPFDPNKTCKIFSPDGDLHKIPFGNIDRIRFGRNCILDVVLGSRDDIRIRKQSKLAQLSPLPEDNS